MRLLFEGGAYLNIVPEKFTFLYIFIQRYTFYLLIFLWTDTKLIVNLELREKFTRWKKPESFMITRAKVSAVRTSGVRCLRRAPLIDFFVPDAALIPGRRLIEGGAYSSKYGIPLPRFKLPCAKNEGPNGLFWKRLHCKTGTDVVAMLFFFKIIAFTLSWLLRLLISWRPPPPRSVQSNSPTPLVGLSLSVRDRAHDW